MITKLDDGREARAAGTRAMTVGAVLPCAAHGPPDERQAIATLRAAVDAGVEVVDTGHMFSAGRCEQLIARALRGSSASDVAVSAKFGAQRDRDGAWVGFDVRPGAVRPALLGTLARLGRDHVDVFRPAAWDPEVPVEEIVGAVADLVRAGRVRRIGLADVSAETLRRAAAVHPISDVHVEYGLLARAPEQGLLGACRDLGVGVTAYGAIGRGRLSSRWSGERARREWDVRVVAARRSPGGDARAGRPDGRDGVRAAGWTDDPSERVLARVRTVAHDHGATCSQVSLAWLLAQRPAVTPMVGARGRDRLTEALGSTRVHLDAEQVAWLGAPVTTAPGALTATPAVAAVHERPALPVGPRQPGTPSTGGLSTIRTHHHRAGVT